MRALEFIKDHVNFKLPYDFSYQMKTPQNQIYCAINYLFSREKGRNTEGSRLMQILLLRFLKIILKLFNHFADKQTGQNYFELNCIDLPTVNK